jgi:hypothetical protein
MTADVEPRLTRAERADLLRVARMRAKVSRSSIDARKGELLVEFERQVSAIYDPADEAWADLVAKSRAATAACDAELAERCRALGIDERFRPKIAAEFFGRRQNASAERRAELRGLAIVEVDAGAKRAKHAIDAAEADVCGHILADGLGSIAASEYLAAIPTPDALMPPLDLTVIEAKAVTR